MAITEGKTMITDKQREEFSDLAEQLIKWMCENLHPHHTVIITQTSAELAELSAGFTTTQYLKD